MRKFFWLIVGVLVVFGIMAAERNGLLWAAARDGQPAAGGGAGPKVGQTYTVYLRGDASGAAFGNRLPDLGNLITRRGAVEAIDGQWLVLKDGGRRYHIPRASIMVLESDAKDAGEIKPAGKAGDDAKESTGAGSPPKADVNVGSTPGGR